MDDEAQGTVVTFEPDERSGSVLLDDGTRVRFDGTALIGSGLRLLRPGQRVGVAVDRTGTANRVWLPTLDQARPDTTVGRPRRADPPS